MAGQRQNDKVFQCQGEHRVADKENGDCIFYCQLLMSHVGPHIDCRGLRWSKLFPWSRRPSNVKRGRK